jgi:5-methylcytosine-specific restriction endonuclease McrA
MEEIFESLKTFVMTEEDWSRHPIVSENHRESSSGFLGLTHSEESKKIMSNIKKGKKRSLEVREAISKGKTGKPRSEETKEKIRKSNLGKKRSAETIRKLKESHIGHKITAEESLARSIRMTGKKRGPYKRK